MAEFKLGRIRFVWKDTWTVGQTYYKDDIVRYGGKTYLCVVGHVANTDFYTDLDNVPTKWNQVSDGQEWKGDWITSNYYKINDLVKYGAFVYICKEGHESAATFTLGLEQDLSKWDLFAENFSYVGTWATAARYKLNDVVKYGGNTYLCNTKHTSAATTTLGLEDDLGSWTLYTEGFDWRSEWVPLERYRINDVVKYGGTTYVCNFGHTSAATETLGLEDDQAYWDYMNQGTDYKGTWSNANVRYKINDLVKYGSGIWICTTYHTSAVATTFETDANAGNWAQYVEGLEFQDSWTTLFIYQPGDIVTYGGYAYISKTNHTSAALTPPSTNTTDWDLYTTSIKFEGEWSSATDYRVGDIVRLGGYTYVATSDNTNHTPPNLTYWDRLNSGIRWKGQWLDDFEYELGDAVRYGTNSYICILSHISDGDDYSSLTAGSTNSRPDQDITGTYWNLLSSGSEESVLTTTGDLVYYSGVGPTRLPIGEEGQVLRVGSTGTPEWAFYGVIDKLVYVAPHGVDSPAPGYGTTLDRPWASIRYATEQIAKGYENPNAQTLLEMNRIFIQKEVTQWITWQIANSGGSGIWNGFTYNSVKCERDVGFLVDRIIWDLGHGGNLKMRAAAQTYLNLLSEGPYSNEDENNGTGAYSNLGAEADNDIAAFNYMESLIDAVLNQYPPAVNYQVLNSVTPSFIVGQFTDPTLTVETGVTSAVTELVGIVTTALSVGTASAIPDRSVPNYTINVKTGLYSEILPIIVPVETAVVGDELRSTKIEPSDSLIDISDAYYTVTTFDHIADVVGKVVAGTTVTPTAGNTVSQSKVAPLATSTETSTVTQLVNVMKHQSDFKLGTLHASTLTDPTGYNVGYLTGYGDARKLIKENKKFFQEEVIAYLVANYSTMKYGKTKARRDAGYIVDAVIYDLTYGGNAMSVKAGLAYWDGDDATQPQLPDSIKVGTLASINYLSTIMQAVATNTTVSALQTTIPQYRDTAGSAGSATFIGAKLIDISNIITTGPSAVGTSVTLSDPTATNGVNTTTALINAKNTLIAANETIVTGAVDYVNTNYGSFTYNSTYCRRDAGYLVDAAYYDAAFGSNFWAVQNGLSYLRTQASAVTTLQKTQEIGAVNYIKAQAAAVLESNGTAVSRSNASYTEIADIINNGLASADALVYTDTGTANFTNARAQLVTNRAFIISEMVTWMTANAPAYVALSPANKLICQRDLGYTIDALAYDVNYDGNTATRNICRSLFNNITGVSVQLTGEQADSAASYTQLGAICAQIVSETYAGQDVSGTAASATEATRMTTLAGNIASVVTAGNLSGLVAESLPSISWVDGGIQTAVGALASARTTIVKGTLQYITTTYSSLVYSHAKAERDATIILKAVAYDFMFNSNYQTIKAAHAYLRGTAEEIYASDLVLKNATRGALSYAKTQALLNVGGDVTAQARITTLMQLVDDIVFGGGNEGSMTGCPTELSTNYSAALQLERNRDFIVEETRAYIAATFTGTVTAVANTNDLFTISSTSWMKRNMAIRFTGTTFGPVSTGTTYYVQSIVSSTQFTIATSRYATSALNVTADVSGSMTVSFYYNQSFCLRDVGTYIDALKYDLSFPGNFKSRYVARYYVNAVTGSYEEDFFYLRNGTGLRNCTLQGLAGDLGPANSYGTSRPSAGAYASLDPGFGPDDFSAWIIARSPYVQNVTTFGAGCIGQKIDSDIHNGGYSSIVSNDFTQILDDGIGAWVTNLGRAELVSVFTYYCHIGYLAEEGGKIRATNGNNSYGDYGSVAEGIDITETAITGIVNNRGFEAQIGNVFTNGDQLLSFEYTNAGVGYYDGTYTISGAGNNAAVFQDEFRDGGTYEVRLTDPGDSSGPGGSGYITAANIAQDGTTTQITLAATDTRSSLAYVGMAIAITAGTGAGQYGYINSYNALTKIATIKKESDGASGWDHIIPGTTIASALDLTTYYEITPRLAFTSPTYSTATATNDLPTSDVWSDIIYGAGSGTYTAVIASGGSGSGAKFNITRREGVYIVTQNTLGLGVGFTVGNTLTIAGTALGGTSPANSITITITAVDTTNANAIDSFTYTGTAISQQYVAVSTGSSAVAATSPDGIVWTQQALSATANWTSVTYGTIDSIGYYVAVASGSTVASYSINGIDWVAMSGLPSGTWTGVTYGNDRFVAVASGGTVSAYSTNGTSWSAMSGLPSASWNAVSYGKGLFVAVAGGGTVAASSANGTSWTSRTIPSGAYIDVTYGNGRFVALIPSSASGAYSINGTTWTTMTQVNRAWTHVTYGNGVFLGVASSNYACTSEDGINWTERTSVPASAVTYGNPGGTVQFISLKNGTNDTTTMKFGAKTRARSFVDNNLITQIWITEPGGGYTVAPTLTITDPNNVGADATTTVRIGNGVLGSPTFTNRGTGYSSASATVTGSGYADQYQTGTFINVSGLTAAPEPGANLQINGIDDVYYRLVQVTQFLGAVAGEYSARLQISPALNDLESPEHGASVVLRRRYSQVRLTGHDFLDIGTGNTTQSNYPGLPLQDKIPANETVDHNGGRVFYTSTDQDGNFRVGGLFNVEQATGIATLNADAFNIAGLNELQLGSVALGGAGAVISEFSTDPFFTADSDNIVPTQRAIKAYIASQIGGGGSSINVNSLTAGVIYIAGNYITTTTNVQIDINTKMNFTAGVDGSPVALNYFLLG